MTTKSRCTCVIRALPPCEIALGGLTQGRNCAIVPPPHCGTIPQRKDGVSSAFNRRSPFVFPCDHSHFQVIVHRAVHLEKEYLHGHVALFTRSVSRSRRFRLRICAVR